MQEEEGGGPDSCREISLNHCPEVGENVPPFLAQHRGGESRAARRLTATFQTFSTVPTNDTKLSRAETALELGRTNTEKHGRKKKKLEKMCATPYVAHINLRALFKTNIYTIKIQRLKPRAYLTENSGEY